MTAGGRTTLRTLARSVLASEALTFRYRMPASRAQTSILRRSRSMSSRVHHMLAL